MLAGRYLRIGTGGIGAAFAGTAIGCWLIVRVLLLPGLTGELGAAWKGWVDAVPGYGSLWLVPQLLGASEPDPATSLGGRFLQVLFGWFFKVGPVGAAASSVLSLLVLALLVVLIVRFTVIADARTSPAGRRPGPARLGLRRVPPDSGLVRTGHRTASRPAGPQPAGRRSPGPRPAGP